MGTSEKRRRTQLRKSSSNFSSSLSAFPPSLSSKKSRAVVKSGKTKEVFTTADPHEGTLFLIYSSFFFLLPAVYAAIKGSLVLGLVSYVTSLISANYWRLPLPGLRKTADLIVAKVSFLVYFITGLFFVRDSFSLLLGWPNAVMMLSAYYLSHQRAQRGCRSWIRFHALFHLSVALGQVVVVYGSSRETLTLV